MQKRQQKAVLYNKLSTEKTCSRQEKKRIKVVLQHFHIFDWLYAKTKQGKRTIINWRKNINFKTVVVKWIFTETHQLHKTASIDPKNEYICSIECKLHIK